MEEHKSFELEQPKLCKHVDQMQKLVGMKMCFENLELLAKYNASLTGMLADVLKHKPKNDNEDQPTIGDLHKTVKNEREDFENNNSDNDNDRTEKRIAHRMVKGCIFKCYICHKTKTPQVRFFNDPHGTKRAACNSCGLRVLRKQRKDKRDKESAAAAKQIAAPDNSNEKTTKKPRAKRKRKKKNPATKTLTKTSKGKTKTVKKKRKRKLKTETETETETKNPAHIPEAESK